MSFSQKKPKMNIPKSRTEWCWDIAGYVFYVASISLLFVVWNNLPEEVPAHYNAVGEIDRWGSKWELLILPGIGTFLLLLMQVLEKHPEKHNYPKRFDESNAEQFYLHSRKLVNQLKNICMIIFAVILFESISAALQWEVRLNEWMLPLLLLGTGIPIVTGLWKRKNIY